MYLKCVAVVFFAVLSCLNVELSSSCSQKTFEDKSKGCVNEFFSAIKENSKQDCRSTYRTSVKSCIKDVLRKCQNTTDSKNFTIMRLRSQTFIATSSYFCDDGMLNSFKRHKLTGCQEKALAKVRKCAESFHKKFRENKQSRSLCRKFSKAKECIRKTLDNFCKKTDAVQSILRLYRDSYNPYCPGYMDSKRKPRVRSPLKPFGSCTEREYLTLTRVCLSSFVYTLQKEPRKSCSSVFDNKLHSCAKRIALHCHKNESNYAKKNIERSFARSRAYQERKFCDGINFQLSFPPLMRHQCAEEFFAAKRKCEENYVNTYIENKADETLCRSYFLGKTPNLDKDDFRSTFEQKYAEAKQCAKNATLSLCNVTPGQRDEVNFMYDGFNPFCFNLSDPPAAEKSRGLGERVPRESGDQRPMEPSDPSTDAVLRGGGEQSVSATPLSLVVVMFMQVLRAAVS